MLAIKVKDLTKKFGDFSAVHKISFDVEEGKIFAFLGPNGAGKTTTIKMHTTLLHPTSGEAWVNNFNIAEEREAVRRSFGIVFQDQSLDEDLSARENMEFHARLYGGKKSENKNRIEELLKFVDLSDRRDDLVKNFSGGMKRRLEIARSLIHTPRIIFLDEPTLGLDPQTRNHIWSYVLDLCKREGITVFLTTHYMEEAEKMADVVAIIDHGKIVSQGSPAELKAKTGADTLEKAFLKLTGSSIRTEEASSSDLLRTQARMWGRR